MMLKWRRRAAVASAAAVVAGALSIGAASPASAAGVHRFDTLGQCQSFRADVIASGQAAGECTKWWVFGTIHYAITTY